MGELAYEELVKFCDARMEAIALLAKEQKKNSLPFFVIHPATAAHQK